MSSRLRFLPWVILALCLAYVGAATFRTDAASEVDWKGFGSIPVSSEGRTKPMDTVARSALMVLGGKQTAVLNGKRRAAIEWLADVIAQKPEARSYEVFRIDHPNARSMLHLPADARRRFTFEELTPHFNTIVEQANLANEVLPRARDSFQRQIMDIYDHLTLYTNLSQLRTPYVLPPLEAGQDWRPLQVGNGAPASAAANAWIGMLSGYSSGDIAGFNREVAAYRGMLDSSLPDASAKARFEVFFSRAEPFYQATVLFVGALLIAVTGLLLRCFANGPLARSVNSTAFLVLILALAVQTIGIVSRIYIQGRPPVTNLYSSAIFIGWAGVLIGLFIERSFPIGLGNTTAAVLGFSTQIVAHNLTSSGDTMQMMQAVLDTNIWLATHVVVVTIGYSATFLAGFLAIAYILLGVFTPVVRGELAKAMPRAVYGVICFASLASFVGTVLGGIWADQSWGRFWGWDPKENGAALIVLMNLLILHARWGGMIKERGMAVLAVGGNIVTAWSWFGTNMLGVGLHAYGFIESAVFWMLVFVCTQLLIMGIGMIPLRLWRSDRDVRAVEKPEPAPSGKLAGARA